MLVVVEGPGDAPIGRDFNQVRGLAELAMTEPVGDHGVAIGQAMEPRDELEADSRQVVTLDLPHDATIRVRFEDAGAARKIAARDEGVAVGQAHRAVGAAGRRDVEQPGAVRPILAHDLVAVMRDEVVVVGQLPCVAHVKMTAVLAHGEQAHFPGDSTRRFDFEQAAGVALADERVAVRKALAGVDFARRLIIEHNLSVAGDFTDAVAGVEEKVAAREHPEVVALGGLVFPLDASIRGDQEHFALRVIGAGE